MLNGRNLLKIDNLILESYPNIEETSICKAYTTTRKNGVSKGFYKGLNLSLKVGDRNKDVLKNRDILSKALKIDFKNIITCSQVHGSRIIKIEEGYNIKEILNTSGDALITNLRNVPLGVFTADCLPIFILDKKNRVISIVHSGWKGTLERITRKVIKIMEEEYNSNPKFLLVALGASIRGCCYEISSELRERFLKNFFDLDLESDILKKRDKRFYLDIALLNIEELIKAKVRRENIFLSKFCTFCTSEYFFSYRRERKDTGRMLSLIYLR